jgi:uncharacterized protein YacL
MEQITSGEWFVRLALPVAILSIIALWVCFIIVKRMKYNVWYLSAALVFVIGVILSPIVTSISLNFTAAETSLLDYISVLVCVVTAAVLCIIGFTKRNFSFHKENIHRDQQRQGVL